MKKSKQELSIHDLVDIFLPKLWIIISVAIIFSVAAAVYSIAFKSETYTVKTEAYVYQDNHLTLTAQDIEVAKQVLPNYQRTLLGDEFLKLVSIKLLSGTPSYDISPSALSGMISFAIPSETKFFTISVTTSSPTLSYSIARVIEETFPDYLRDTLRDSLPIALADTAEYNPTPNSKNTMRSSIIAFFIGAVISMLLVWLVSVFDLIIHDRKKLESNFDLPVLGVIPRQMPSLPNDNDGGSV